MLHLSLITLVLFNGVLVGPFPLAQAEPDHHQVMVRAAMAPDGRFAIAWIDSLQLTDHVEQELFVRFFNPNGEPVTDAQQITKVVDTNWIHHPCLDMDSAGNVILLWVENADPGYDGDDHVQFQRFDRDGNPLGSAQTVVRTGLYLGKPIGLSCSPGGEFAVVWGDNFDKHVWVWARRYAADGTAQCEAFLVHDSLFDFNFCYPQAGLNDAGDLVVTWYESHETMHGYPRFQVFDADNQPILPWERKGHRLDDGEGWNEYNCTRSEGHWLDNDRFVAFWIRTIPHPYWLSGRVFSGRGQTRHPIKRLVNDSLASTFQDPKGSFSSAVSPDERFASTHTHSYCVIDTNTGEFESWTYAVGELGRIEANEPGRRTNTFEYSPLREDSMGAGLNQCAVAACNNRIVWVWSEWNPDTIFEAYVLITDWDMGIGIEESPAVIQSPIHLTSTLNRLSYDLPGEAQLTLYSADGRRIFEETIEGKGTWVAPIGFPSGVYFARVEGESAAANRKLLVLK